MALITCPNCGRKNVSDYKRVCPECGGPLSFFDDPAMAKRMQSDRNERNAARLREEAETIRLKNERIEEAKETLLPELEQKLEDIDKMPYPEKPSFLCALFDKGDGARISIYLFFAMLALSIFLSVVSKVWFIVSIIITACLGVSIIVVAVFKYKNSMNKYNRVTKDYSGYKEKLKKQASEEYDAQAKKIASQHLYNEFEVYKKHSI